MLHLENNFSELVICKEQELKELQARQINFQKATLQETQKQLQEMQKKFNSLKEDFTYNLKVLDERDRELEHYYTLFIQLKMAENANQAEVSDLRIQVDKLQQALALEIKKQEALQEQYKQKLKEHQLELEHLHSSKDADISHYREEYENMKQQLERKLWEIEGELALQRQEILVEMDAEMKNREHEFRQKADKMSNLVLSHELKVKLLTKELEALKEAGMNVAESLKVAEATNLELEKEIRCKDWEIRDITALQDARIQDLENKLASAQLSWKKEKEIFERKHASIDHFAREKETVIVSLKQTHAKQIRKWEKQIQEQQMSKETLKMELHQIECRFADKLKAKETIIEKLEQALEQLKTSWDSQVAQISKETVSKNLQIQALQEEEIKLKAQALALIQDIERYKQQLSLALEKEESLERAKVQGELEWQRRCEDAERNQYHKSEALIQSLSRAKDQAIAELKEKEQKLHELEVVLSDVTLERDQAIQQLHLLKGKKQDTLGSCQHLPSADAQKLQEQNTILKSIIAEMRREMENLSNQATYSDAMKIQNADTTNFSAILFTPEYIQSLEEEIRKLKKKCQAIDKQNDNFSRKVLMSSPNAPSCNKSTQTVYQHYIVSVNESAVHEIATETDLKKHNTIDPWGDSRKVSPLVKRLPEDSVHLKQQLFGMGAGDGPCQHFGNQAKVIQAGLKKAAKKICSLSKEKQQLLEMVNRLRAELGVASKEEFQDSKDSERPQKHTILDVLDLKEVVKEAKQNFVALEQLQYQLTKQIPEPRTNWDTSHQASTKQVELDSFVRNRTANPSVSKTPVPQQPQQLRRESPRQPAQSLLSSGASSSLEEIWQILEMGSSPSVLSANGNNDQEKGQVIHESERLEESQEKAQTPPLTVKGTKFDVRSKLKPKKLSYMQSKKPHKSRQITKIRNYNIKD